MKFLITEVRDSYGQNVSHHTMEGENMMEVVVRYHEEEYGMDEEELNGYFTPTLIEKINNNEKIQIGEDGEYIYFEVLEEQ